MRNTEQLKNKFKFNEHGVCTNPEVYYQTLGMDRHDGYYIELCCNEKGMWDYGHNMNGGRSLGSSCGAWKMGRYKSRDEAIKAAVEYLKENAELSISQKNDCNNTKEHQKIARKYLDWYSNRGQLVLF